MSDPFISLTCPYCGSNMQRDLKRNLLVCPACGSEHLIKDDAGSLTPPVRENVNTCPHCMRNDQVMKVSAILSSQVHQTEGTTQVSDVSSDYKGRVYTTTRTVPTHAIQMSDLAHKLRMPDPPSNPYVTGCSSNWRYVVYLVTGFLIFYSIFARQIIPNNHPKGSVSYNTLNQTYALLFLAAFLLVLLSFYLHNKYKAIRQNRENYDEQLKTVILPKWGRAQKRWNNAYYCGRDDLVFINNEESSVDADHFSEWLIETTP